MSAEQNNDPLIRQLREQISDADRTIIEAVNVRLKLVARLKDYKESRGMSFVDPEREEWMLNYLTRANRGPLSAEGLQEIFSEVLDLTKREFGRGEFVRGHVLEELLELRDDLFLVHLFALELDRGLLDYVVGGEDRRLGADG